MQNVANISTATILSFFFSPLFANRVELYPSPQRPSREIYLKAFLLDLDLNINKYNVAIVMSPPYQKLFLDFANNRPI